MHPKMERVIDIFQLGGSIKYNLKISFDSPTMTKKVENMESSFEN